jgi:hypothetical protein|tara:strand:+ start:137 stop:418 length:282 start_codon:yes stop_codon:yes gene_type:complete
LVTVVLRDSVGHSSRAHRDSLTIFIDVVDEVVSPAEVSEALEVRVCVHTRVPALHEDARAEDIRVDGEAELSRLSVIRGPLTRSIATADTVMR